VQGKKPTQTGYELDISFPMVADQWLVVKGNSLSKSIEQEAELGSRCKVLGSGSSKLIAESLWFIGKTASQGTPIGSDPKASNGASTIIRITVS